jgi:hypothetical protein
MTGYFIRMKRDGQWQNLDVAELTDAELEQWPAATGVDGWKWAIGLARWIRDKAHARPHLPDQLAEIDLYAWVGEDEHGSDEIGLKQAIVPAGCIPIVATSRDKVDRAGIRAQMQAMVNEYGKTRYLVRYTGLEVVAVLKPSEKESPKDLSQGL